MHSTLNTKLFALFCLASFLLSLSYGSTFLLSLLIQLRGGMSTMQCDFHGNAQHLVAVVVSGHLADAWGRTRHRRMGLLLVVACLGFALTPGLGEDLKGFGLALGLGWGVFIPWGRSSWRCWWSLGSGPDTLRYCRAAC
jgi:hypothetical protein